MPDPIDRVADPVERKLTVAAAMRALRRLPVEDREALLMRAGDVSYEDIAPAFGISVGAAKVRVHRSRARLLRLGGYGGSSRRLADADEAAEAPPVPASNPERAAVERTRRLLRLRSWTMAAAILCTLLPLTFAHLDGGITFFMFRDVPWWRALWALAAILWTFYIQLHRGTRTTGL